jgi:O-methyltransferase
MRILKNFLFGALSDRPAYPKAGVSGINYQNWTSFKNKSDYMQGYFDFPLYNAKNDSDAKRIRSLLLLSIVKGIVSKDDKISNFAECGCFKGHSSYAISKILQHHNYENKFYIFDSFEGLSNPTNNDILADDGKTVREDLKSLLATDKLKFVGDLNSYTELMSEFPFVDIKKGWIPERFDEVKDTQFSFVHIDVDVYQPTKDSLNFFYNRLVKGGVIVIDDYSRPFWPGCDRAVNEFLDFLPKDGSYRFFEVPLGGAVIIKI